MERNRVTVQELIAARKKRSPAILKFLKCVQKFPGEIIWTFEGKDIQYYSSRLQNFVGLQRAIVDAGGKKNVLDVLDFAKNNPDIDLTKTAFFVDRDFDQKHPDDKCLYVTPSYSIENLYAAEETIAGLLQTQFGVTSFEFDFVSGKVLKWYRKWLSKFLSAVRVLNAWILLQKSKPGYCLNLSSVKLSKLVNFSWQDEKLQVKKLYTITALKKLFPDAAQISATEVNASAEADFAVDDSLKWKVRGKYFIDFLYEVVTKLVSDAGSTTPTIFDKKRNVLLRVSKSNFLGEISGHAYTSPCLRTFLAQYAAA